MHKGTTRRLKVEEGDCVGNSGLPGQPDDEFLGFWLLIYPGFYTSLKPTSLTGTDQ